MHVVSEPPKPKADLEEGTRDRSLRLEVRNTRTHDDEEKTEGTVFIEVKRVRSARKQGWRPTSGKTATGYEGSHRRETKGHNPDLRTLKPRMRRG